VKKAAYGEHILATVSQELKRVRARLQPCEIARMIRLARLFLNEAIVVTLSRQLNWSHFIEVPPLPLLRARLHQAIAHARESAIRRLPDAEEQT